MLLTDIPKIAAICFNVRLFGDGNITDAQLEEVKRFAAYVRSRDQK